MGGARVNRHNKSRGRAEGQSTGSKVCPKCLSRLRVVVFLPLGLVAQHDCHPRLVIVLRHCEARPGWVKVQLVKGIGVNADSVRPTPLLEVDNVTLSRETRGYHVITFARTQGPAAHHGVNFFDLRPTFGPEVRSVRTEPGEPFLNRREGLQAFWPRGRECVVDAVVRICGQEGPELACGRGLRRRARAQPRQGVAPPPPP